MPLEDKNTRLSRSNFALGVKMSLGCPVQYMNSGEASPTFGHANANFSVFIERIRNQFLKKLIITMI